MAHAQQNMSSEGSWAQPVVSLTPNVEPIANATPDVALNVITYPNVTFATKHAWNGTAVPQPEPQMQAASRSVLRVYRPLEHDAHSSRIVPPPLPKAPTPRGTGKPIVPLRITPSTRLAGASSPNSSGAYATLFITTGVVALAALAFVLWLLRIRASKNPLDQETRKAIHAHVVEAPGINVAGLKKKMGLSENTITYHLRRLVKEGIVAAHTEENGRAAFFPNRSEHGRFEREVLAAMRHPLKARILSYVHAEGSVLTPQLVQALGKDERIVKYHANNLIGIGLLIGRAEPGQSKRFTVNSLYVQAFERVLKDGPRTVPDFPLPPQPRGSLPEGGLGEAAYHNA
jgi:predicted transcriptional regulator